MNRIIYFTLLFYILPINPSFANCDTSTFRWECDIPVKKSPKSGALSVVHCGGAIAYVTHAEYAQLTRNQRANINMVLKQNGEYLDGPCVPVQR